MVKIAHLSDIHLDHRERQFNYSVPADCFHVAGAFHLPLTPPDADVFIIAGDLHPREYIRDAVIDRISTQWNLPIIFCPGNHDYWDGEFPNIVGDIYEVKGIKIASSTLWTHIKPNEYPLTRNFSDFDLINNISIPKWNGINEESVKFLIESAADVIVTHHTPSQSSIDSQYIGDPYNCFFANDLDLSLFNSKVWLHGHSHAKLDIIDKGIRLIRNPLGYPFEKTNAQVEVFEV